MTTTQNLPPQAYTRETLAAAFEWIKTQPAYVRQLATNSDSLVAVYLQHKRRQVAGIGPVENHQQNQMASEVDSPSVEQFKRDLKNLQEGPMKVFAEPSFVPTDSPSHVKGQSAEPQKAQAVAPPQGQPSPLSSPLDAQSEAKVREVRVKLNLSSESEALRMMIALGFEKIRDILPT